MFYAIILTLAGATSTGPFDTLAACNARMVPDVQWLMHNAPNAGAQGSCVPAPIAADMLAARACVVTGRVGDGATYACVRRAF